MANNTIKKELIAEARSLFEKIKQAAYTDEEKTMVQDHGDLTKMMIESLSEYYLNTENLTENDI
jgi:chemotaxis regulatin CheY-phosphate phosphatase CheZ